MTVEEGRAILRLGTLDGNIIKRTTLSTVPHKCHLSSIHADKGGGSRSDVVLPDASETENYERTTRALGPEGDWPAGYPVKVLLAAPVKVLLPLYCLFPAAAVRRLSRCHMYRKYPMVGPG